MRTLTSASGAAARALRTPARSGAARTMATRMFAARLFRFFLRLGAMPLRCVSVMCAGFVFVIFVMLRGFTMMLGGIVVMFGRARMMLR